MDHSEPETFVLATGRNASVRDFTEWPLRRSGSILSGAGRGPDEEGVCKKTGKSRVKVNPAFFRPAEVDELVGDPAACATIACGGRRRHRSKNCAG